MQFCWAQDGQTLDLYVGVQEDNKNWVESCGIAFFDGTLLVISWASETQEKSSLTFRFKNPVSRIVWTGLCDVDLLGAIFRCNFAKGVEEVWPLPSPVDENKERDLGWRNRAAWHVLYAENTPLNEKQFEFLKDPLLFLVQEKQKALGDSNEFLESQDREPEEENITRCGDPKCPRCFAPSQDVSNEQQRQQQQVVQNEDQNGDGQIEQQSSHGSSSSSSSSSSVSSDSTSLPKTD